MAEVDAVVELSVEMTRLGADFEQLEAAVLEFVRAVRERLGIEEQAND